jgi:hypothetical protein
LFELGQSGFALGCFYIADSDKVDHRVGLRPTVVATHDAPATDQGHADAAVRADRVGSGNVREENGARNSGKAGFGE